MLVERIIHKILEEKVDMDQLLVVTFTNAAAAEMRERVFNAIVQKIEEQPEDSHLQKQLTLLNVANICTIDSFCLEVVRNYFYELENVSPNFRIADTPEIELLKQEILEELFEKKYEQEDVEFTKLIETYTSYREDSPLKDLILKIEGYMATSPFPEKWLKEKIEMFYRKEFLQEDFSKTPWGQILLEDLKEEVTDALVHLKEINKELERQLELEPFYQIIKQDITQLEYLQSQLISWDSSYQVMSFFKWDTWPRKKIESSLKEEAKRVRDHVKKNLTKKLEQILICDSKQANEDIQEMYPTLLKLQKIVLEFEQEFTKRKREKNIVDFSDIEHFALKILLEEQDGKYIPTKVAKKYAEKFVEIAIDEYQDSNLVQELILSSISRRK